MRMATRKWLIGGLIMTVALSCGVTARAGEKLIYDFFSPYLQRFDGIMPGAGDATAVNSVTHVIDPWPPYVTNRRIPGDGERMANVIRRYHDVSKLPCAPPPLAPVQIEITSLAGRGGVLAAAAAAGVTDCNSTSSAGSGSGVSAGTGGAAVSITAPAR